MYTTGSFKKDSPYQISESMPYKTVTIRTCTVDGGSMTSDTELIRNEHSCGQIALSNGLDITDKELNSDSQYRLYACIDICTSSHGCNKSSKSVTLSYFLLIFWWIAIFISQKNIKML